MARNVKVTQHPVDPSNMEMWRERIANWEESVIADARLLGELPVLDYADRPFEVPVEIDAALRQRRDPRWKEVQTREAREARREALHRIALAAMLREKGDALGAAAQDEAATHFDRLAAQLEEEVRCAGARR